MINKTNKILKNFVSANKGAQATHTINLKSGNVQVLGNVAQKSQHEIQQDIQRQKNKYPQARKGSVTNRIRYNKSVCLALACDFPQDTINLLWRDIVQSISLGVCKWENAPQTPIRPRITPIKKAENTRQYNFIDKRQTFKSINILDIGRLLFARETISKNQYKTILCYVSGKKKFLSQDIQSKINVYVSHLGKPHKTSNKSKSEICEISKVTCYGATYRVKNKIGKFAQDVYDDETIHGEFWHKKGRDSLVQTDYEKLLNSD